MRNLAKVDTFVFRQVERSMKRLDTAVWERETSLRLLQTGQEKGRPGAWRRNMFGQVLW